MHRSIFSGIVTNILNIVTLSRFLKAIIYKLFLGMACADLMVSS